MTALKDVMAAPGVAQEQRFRLRSLLKINHANAAPQDLALCDKLLAAPTPADYDAMLVTPEVQSLFARSVLLLVRTGSQS